MVKVILVVEEPDLGKFAWEFSDRLNLVLTEPGQVQMQLGGAPRELGREAADKLGEPVGKFLKLVCQVYEKSGPGAEALRSGFMGAFSDLEDEVADLLEEYGATSSGEKKK